MHARPVATAVSIRQARPDQKKTPAEITFEMLTKAKVELLKAGMPATLKNLSARTGMVRQNIALFLKKNPMMARRLMIEVRTHRTTG